MGKGRKPLPSSVKLDETVMTTDDMEVSPDPPTWLQPLAVEEWRRIMPELMKVKAVTILDLNSLAAYCQTYAQWRDINDRVIREGPIIAVLKYGIAQPIRNPACHQEVTLLNMLLRFHTAFGMSPKSRSQIKLRRPPSKAEDDFDDFVESGNDQHDPINDP